MVTDGQSMSLAQERPFYNWLLLQAMWQTVQAHLSQKNKAHTGITKPRCRESLCPRLTLVRTPTLTRSITKNLPQIKQAPKQETKLSKRQPNQFFFSR